MLSFSVCDPILTSMTEAHGLPSARERRGIQFWQVLAGAAAMLAAYILLGLYLWRLPPLEVAFFGWFIGIGPLVLWLTVARAKPTPRRQFISGEHVSFSLPGGAAWSVAGTPWRVSWPFARLELLEQGLRIRGILVPTWEWRWHDIDSIRFSGQTCHLRLRDATDGIRFFGTRRRLADLSSQLREKGISVQ